MPNAEFDVFLSHNSNDKPEVLKLAAKLKDMGINPWLDAWHLTAGEPWLPAIERALNSCTACAVVVGPHLLGDVHEEEMWSALQRGMASNRRDRRFRVIPVLLPNCTRGDRARLPWFLTANTWVEFQHSIEEPANLEKLRKAVRGEPPGTGVSLTPGECPYRGLAYFDVQHAPLFFGREAQVDWLLSRLRGTASKDGSTRFLAVVGSSGSGKSSLTRAGLLAKLRQGEITGSARWPLVICRPESRPLESLATALASTEGVSLGTGLTSTLIGQLSGEMLKSAEQLHLVAQGTMPANDSDWRLVVFVDQFEELFVSDEAGIRGALATSRAAPLDSDRIAFLHNLLRAATIENGRTIVILAMRADFYGKCAAFPDLATAVSQHQELVGPMRADELRCAIETPALLSGSALEPGLVDLLAREVADKPGALPLLQYTLAELWRKSRDLGFSKLTTSAYRELGGWEGALSQRADAVVAKFRNTPQEKLCRQLFLRLVRFGEDTGDTKRVVRWQELHRDNADEATALEQTVRKLADSRLITTSGDKFNADSTIEIAHEALIQSWPQLRSWLDADRTGLRIHRKLTEASAEWDDARRQAAPAHVLQGLLYRTPRLELALDFRAENQALLSRLEHEFLDHSVAAQTEERRKLQRLADLEAKEQTQIEKQVLELKAKEAIKPTLLDQFLPKSFLGFDFFLSYAWNDGRQYAITLAEELKKLGFACWLDSAEYTIGDDWRTTGRSAAKRASALIVIASPGALMSLPVLQEAEYFLRLSKPILPVVFENSLRDAGDGASLAELIRDRIYIFEPIESLSAGPSLQALEQISKFFTRRYRARTLRLTLSAVATVVAVALSLGYVLGRILPK